MSRQGEASKRWREKYPDKHKSGIKRNQQKRKDRVKEFKEQPCADCGQQYPSYVMDLDHVRGEKVAHVSTMVCRASMERIEVELLKCDVVCANCHRERHHGTIHA